MRIAWFSPLNPQPSGIADYCEELLPELSRYVEIDLYVDPAWEAPPAGIAGRFRVRPYAADAFPAAAYDQIVYHMGNDFAAHRFVHEALLRHPGVVVLHDLVLMGFYAARENAGRRFADFVGFLQRFYPERAEWIAARCGGRHPFPVWEGGLALELPMNEEVCRSATALIVHSRFVLERLRLPAGKPAAVIPHHGHAVRACDRQAVRRALGVGDNELLLVSTGYVTRNKRYGLVLEALRALGRSDLRYLIVGRDRDGILAPLLAGAGQGVLRRDFAPLAELEAWIAAADIGVNLRNPTMGESSGSLMRMLSYGRPALVSAAGAYAEIPDHCVVKIPHGIDELETLKAALAALAGDGALRQALGREAAAYASGECAVGRCARLYGEFLGRLPGRAKE